MILYRRGCFRIAETWFDQQPNGIRADILRRLQHPLAIAEAQCAAFHTIVIDLNAHPDELLARMKRETRYEIRRAERDQLVYEVWTGADSGRLRQFLRFYDQCVRREGLPRPSSLRLQKLADAGDLDLSRVRGEGAVPLVWHAYYRSGQRVRLLHSASLRDNSNAAQRGLVGRANRYQHWQDLLTFQTQGIKTYDFGGWYSGNSDSKLLAINKFKEGFGGDIILTYNCMQGLTRLGRVAVWLYERVMSAPSQ